MKTKAWLTVDDSPSLETDTLTDLFERLNVPAMLFVRGDRLEADPAPVVRAIGKGFVIGSHAFSHRRSSQIGFDAVTDEIRRTDALIDAAYNAAARPRPGKYIRFPHMDRGAGGWIVDFDAVPAKHKTTLIALFQSGLNIDLTPPGQELRALKDRLQDWLKTEGFAAPDWSGVTHTWFRETEMARAVDAMFTFSTSDWMITPRHQGKWAYKTPDDLLRKINEDPWLNAPDSGNIVLMHDQDGMLPITEPLVEHMQAKLDFQPF